MAQDDFRGEKRLVAYVVLAEKPPPTASQLRTFLQQKLPDYMIPSGFVFLESLPLTTNGKVDRQSLALFDCIISDSGEPPVAPRTLVEKSSPISGARFSVWSESVYTTTSLIWEVTPFRLHKSWLECRIFCIWIYPWPPCS